MVVELRPMDYDTLNVLVEARRERLYREAEPNGRAVHSCGNRQGCCGACGARA